MTNRKTSERQTLDSERVVTAAAQLADLEGLDAVSLTRVAERLGVRQPALYRHVDGYDDLIRRLGLLGRVVLVERLTAATIGQSGDDAVVAMANAWRQMVKDHPGIYAATDRYPCTNDEELTDAVDRVVGVLEQALAGYDLSDDNRVHAARTLRSAFHGFSHLESGDGHPHQQDVDETFRHLTSVLCAGIKTLESKS